MTTQGGEMQQGNPIPRSGVRFGALVLIMLAVLGGMPRGLPAQGIDRAAAAELFGRIAALAGADRNPWSVGIVGPVLLVDPRSREVVANEPDAEGLLRRGDGVYVGTLPTTIMIANTAADWGGRRWAMVMWPDGVGRMEQERLVVHESFHRAAPAMGLALPDVPNAHLDLEAGRLWLRLELRALARALAVSGDDQQLAVEDAMVFRAARYTEFPGAAASENALELNEGLAEYTAVRVAIPAAARRGWVAQQVDAREARAARQPLSRDFAYGTGAALGVLLDQQDPTWTMRVTPEASLAELAREAWTVELPASPVADARQRMPRYGGALVEMEEHMRAETHARQQEEFHRRFVAGPVIRLPVDDKFGYSFSPTGVTSMEGVGQVIAQGTVRGGWGTVQVDEGVLLERGEAGVTGVVLEAPGDATVPPMSGRGWTLELVEGWQVVPGDRAGDWRVVRGP